MAKELLKAEMLRGYMFFHHPSVPTLGVLRLDTENEQHWVMVTKETLLDLSKACVEHADSLQTTQ